MRIRIELGLVQRHGWVGTWVRIAGRKLQLSEDLGGGGYIRYMLRLFSVNVLSATGVLAFPPSNY